MLEFDGAAFLNELVGASLASSDPKAAKLVKLFRKYNIDIFDGLAMLAELAAIFAEEKKHD